jgi:ribonuclease HI
MSYVNSDASYRDGWAGIAYNSDFLGSDSQLVPCRTSTEAELSALLLAMAAAHRAGVTSVVFRTDCKSTAHPHRGNSKRLRPLRERVTGYLAEHPEWHLQEVHRSSNVIANRMARRVLKSLAA